MLAAARGLAEIIANRRTQIVQDRDFLDFFSGDVLGIPTLVIIFALVAVAGWVLLNRTTFGRRTFAVGGNAEAARLAGIRVQRHTVKLYVLSGITCGIAAVMLMARTTTGSSTHGTLYELDAIAAVVIGGTLLIGGRGTIVGTVLGVLIFTTLGNVFTLNNLSSSAQAVARGVIIVARRPAAAAAGDRRGLRRAGQIRADPGAARLPAVPAARSGGGSAVPGGPAGDRPGAASPRPDPAAGQHHPGGRPAARTHHCTTARPTTWRRRQGGDTRGENMSATRQRRYRRLASTAVALVGAGALLAGCTGNDAGELRRRAAATTPPATTTRPATPSPSASPRPAADHGWIGRHHRGRTRRGRAVRRRRARRSPRAPTTSAPQISQVETFINDGVDAIVLLPFDGAALTAGRASRRWRPASRSSTSTASSTSPFAARATILGDNYGMGVSAGTLHLRAARATSPTPSSPRSPASTRCR